MKKLLHIIATPRGEESRTLKVSNSFLKAFTESHPDWKVEELDLTKEKLPDLAVEQVNGKYLLLSGKELAGPSKAAWQDILKHIQRFLSADGYLLSTPMWNFSIPYRLKHYLDVIIQPKYLFQYTNTGVEGLIKNKKMVVVASRGGDYGSAPLVRLDYQEPYLRSLFGFVGITDIKFIIAQPMDMGNELQEKRLQVAQGLAKEAAKNF
ncbi:MAG: NAD(P)H-dependent oxidoreductase [Candidatus Omnitrophota bacterium]|nr:NAD(P)H-dependent oxidoreductase [Candidatus Omnitrophota bacterium]